MSNVSNKQPKNWTDEDLVSWATGTLAPGSTVDVNALAAEALRRLGLEGDDPEIAKTAILDSLNVGLGVEEPTSEEPVVETVPVVENTVTAVEPPPEVVAPVTDTIVAPAPVASLAGFEFRFSSPITQTQVVNTLETYIVEMAPGKPHSGNQGVSNQLGLYNVIKTILRQKGPEFNTNFNELLKVVNKFRNQHFHEKNAFRYWGRLEISDRERQSFENMLSLLLTTSEPSTRAITIKQVDLNEITKKLKDSDVHQKLEGFYKGL